MDGGLSLSLSLFSTNPRSRSSCKCNYREMGVIINLLVRRSLLVLIKYILVFDTLHTPFIGHVRLTGSDRLQNGENHFNEATKTTEVRRRKR